MTRSNKLVQSPPFSVEITIRQLGENLRIARVRRNMTIAEVAERIGTGPRAVMDAEKGKPSTSIVVYAALLWLYDQLKHLSAAADPLKDEEGLVLELRRSGRRPSKRKGLSDDF